MSKITRIADIQNHLVQDDENGYLYENRETRTERIYPFFFIQFHHLHTNSCLITLVFFLNGFYLWLDDLHASLRHEHLLLWDEESETDDEGDGDDSTSETISWEEEGESDKEIIDRIIKESPEKETKRTSMTDRERYF